MSLRLRSEMGRGPYLAALIIIYLRGINHIPLLLIVYIILFFFAHFLLLFAIQGGLLESTFAPHHPTPLHILLYY